jgi:hypothetical protein
MHVPVPLPSPCCSGNRTGGHEEPSAPLRCAALRWLAGALAHREPLAHGERGEGERGEGAEGKGEAAIRSACLFVPPSPPSSSASASAGWLGRCVTCEISWPGCMAARRLVSLWVPVVSLCLCSRLRQSGTLLPHTRRRRLSLAGDPLSTERLPPDHPWIGQWSATGNACN